MAKTSADSVSVDRFGDLVRRLPEIALEHHHANLLSQATRNRDFIEKSIKRLSPPARDKAESAIIICSGPSLKRQRTLEKLKSSDYPGALIAADGAYLACLKIGLVPDYVLTVDPHPSRIVRWFGDPDFEQNSNGDDYFRRQDLDVALQEDSKVQNQEHIDLVNRFANQTKMLICACTSPSVEQRTRAAGFDRYWWNPVVDLPQSPESLTRRLYNINKLPCMNTGGQCGTACYVFAATILNIKNVAMVGMDCGYYSDTPYRQTQCYYELLKQTGSEDDLDEFFPKFTFPLTGESFYTDPSYFRYREIFLELRRQLDTTTFNCTEGGILFGPGVICSKLEEFIKRFTNG